MTKFLFVINCIISLLSRCQEIPKLDLQYSFRKIDSIVTKIDSNKDFVVGVVDGSDDNDNGFTWNAYYLWNKTTRQIHKLSYRGSHGQCVYYFADTIIIKISRNSENFYAVNTHFVDRAGTQVDQQLRGDINRGKSIISAIRKFMR